jgi:tRNA A-37 threonylcarbamoyl transferase component Bud32
VSAWERATALFGAARELAPGDRAAFLDLACRGDDTLRADVEGLLADDAHPDGFLAEPLVGPSLTALFREPAAPAAGDLLRGRYRIEGPIGSGGQAFVHLATDTLLSRSVVVKVMRAAGDQNAALRARFEQERDALARLDHPGVVGILDVGALADGAPYLVLQHVAGESLRQVLGAGPLPRGRAAEILRQLGAALGATHAAGVAHHDVKPENIMLQRSASGADTVKLIDFGIAKVEQAGAAGLHTVLVAGTVRYMAPEQFEGRNLLASDVYALALVACEMLTGRPDPRASPARLGARVCSLIERGLAYEPEDRPTDVRLWTEQLAQALVRERIGLRGWGAAAAMLALMAGAAAATRWALLDTAEQPRIVEKVGAFDPLAEGFLIHNEIRGTVAQNPSRDGYDGWRVFSPRQGHYYRRLTSRQKRVALERGWALTAVLRAEEGEAFAGLDFVGEGRRFDIVVNRNGSDDVVRLQTQIAPTFEGLDMRMPHDESYHRFELRYEPATRVAALWVDGEKRLSGYPGFSQFQGDGDIIFGVASYRSERGVASFQSVRFEIEP